MTNPTTDSENADLGLDGDIDRRDFVGMMLAGAASIAATSLPGCASESPDNPPVSDASGWTLSPNEFNGFGGEGDYARCNGNTWEVANSAHRVRDKVFDTRTGSNVIDTGETYDLVVVGGGPSGLGSAYHFRKRAGDGASCLVLENHSMFGGLAKRNEMTVEGVRLMAPQGSNVFSSTTVENDTLISPSVLDDIGLTPAAIEYGAMTGSERDLEFDRTSFVYYYPPANSDSLGFFADSGDAYTLLRNPWANGFEGAPFGDELKKEYMRWRFETEVPDDIEDRDRWLDSMTYQEYLQNVHGFSDAFCRVINKFIGGGKAFNGEICSAYAMSFNRYAGLEKRAFLGINETYDLLDSGTVRADGFPGGNAMVARYFAKYLIPAMIDGGTSPSDIVNNPVRLETLDRAGQSTRMRLESTVIAVRHAGPVEKAKSVEVVYERGGQLYRVQARSVVMASGAWINKHVLRDAPPRLGTALGDLRHSPMLIANVALNNWRFMEKAGVTCCLWDRGDFGFQCSLRQPMHDGDYRPPLDPNKPIFLTFYAPFVYPGNRADVQTILGRNELLTTPFQAFERGIRLQLTRMFADYGFDAARDISGIILNRWGHAYVAPGPGFFFGRNGNPAARDVIREGYGRIGFAHSELYGFQSIQTAVLQAESAVERVMRAL